MKFNNAATADEDSRLVSPYALVGERLVDAGYSAIPAVPGDKIPGLMRFGKWQFAASWQKYCDRIPTEIEANIWNQWPDAGVCVALGNGGLIAVDIDTEDAEITAAILSCLPESTVAKKGAKGKTLFYRGNVRKADPETGQVTGAIPSRGFNVGNERVLDLLAFGKQTVLPPSIHPKGFAYQWITEDTLVDTPIEQLPILPDNVAEHLASALLPFGYTEPTSFTINQTGDSDSYWRGLKDLAFANLDIWVPALGLPSTTKRNADNWRAVAAWRGVENPNLSFTSKGIKDYGDNDKTYSPIDVVVEAHNTDVETATRWLAEKLDYRPLAADDGEFDVAKFIKANLDPPVPANDNSPKPRFEITWFDDVDQHSAKDELVAGVIGAGEFSLWVAKPGTGKSVLVGDIGLHISAGRDWHGRKVQSGLVVFFAAERKRLTERRVAAWRKEHGLRNLPFVVVGGTLDLTTGLLDAKALSKTISELEKTSGRDCVLVILDTVSRTFGPGDQNQSKDMNRYVQSVDELSRSTKAHIAAIHHSTWTEGRGKGAIDLDGAIDVSFEVTVDGKGSSKVFTLRCTGANDGDEGDITSFKLKSVTLGTDSLGNETSAPVVVPVTVVPQFDASTLKGHNEKVFASFKRALTDVGEEPPEGAPSHIERVVSRALWRERYHADQKTTEPDVTDNTLDKRFGRAVSALTEKTIGQRNDWFWPNDIDDMT